MVVVRTNVYSSDNRTIVLMIVSSDISWYVNPRVLTCITSSSAGVMAGSWAGMITVLSASFRKQANFQPEILSVL